VSPAANGTGPATIRATRYVEPFREGGSLPGLVEADDDGLYVLKFHGAGQGPRALVAELIAGEVARAAGLRVPEIAFVVVEPELGAAEPDAEIRDLLRASPGLNLGLDFLPGSLAYDPAAHMEVDPELAAEVVWLDTLLTNVDRTANNPNLLVWHGRLWLIDHGAALYAHHGDPLLAGAWRRPFPAIAEHVLLPLAGPIDAAGERLAARLDGATIDEIIAAVPDDWLADTPSVASPEERRAAYAAHLRRRVEARHEIAEEAERARPAA
jgi:hypothetical protein